MNIEHSGLLSWFHESRDPSKRKNHAQDGGTLIAMKSQTQRPAILPWSLCFEWRPSFRWYGHLARYAQLPDCCWTFLLMITFENLNNGFTDHAKTRATSARELNKSTTNVMLFEQRLVTRLVLPLDVIEKRTARRHELQKATTRMVVLHVGLEMPGEVVDAFRQDRDLNLGRAGVAGFVGIRLDDFRFTFGGNRHRQTLSFWLRPELAVSPVRLNTRLGMSSPLPISARARSRPATVT